MQKNIWFQDNDYINLEHFFQNITVGRAYDLSGLAESYGIDTFGRIQLKMISSKDIKESIINKDDLIHFAKNALKLKSCLNLDENRVELPNKLKGFEGISIKRITPDGIINENGEVIRPEKTTDTTLTAILNDGLQSIQKDFEITIVGNEQVNVVHTFDLEDAKPGEHVGSCLDKPYYSDPNKTDDVTLGNPKLTWNLKNTIISATRHDTANGHFALSGRYDNPANLEEDRQVRIELKSDYNFDAVEFSSCVHSFFSNDIQLVPSYSLDGGVTRKETNKIYSPINNEFETIRFVIPEKTTNKTRIALTMKKGVMINIDDIKLLKLNA